MIDLFSYLKYSIINGYPNDITWIADMFTIIAENKYKDEFIKIEDNKYYVNVDNEYILINENYKNNPLLTPKDKITINKEFLNMVDKPTDTTIGRLIMNYLIVYGALNMKIPYINKEMNFEDIEKYISENLVDNDSPDKGITVKEYKDYMNTSTYIMNFNRFLSISATPKTILPPAGIEKYKKELIEQMIKKYGPDALSDKTVLAEIDAKLSEYDKEFLKNDPALGKLLTGKSINARKKMFLSFGLGNTFDHNTKPVYVENSLYDGYAKDPKKLSAIFNDSRFGSYSRGFETQQGGVVAKVALRVTNDIYVKEEDCGTKLYLLQPITEDNYKKYLDRYMFDDSGKTVLITMDIIKNYIGKTIKLRSPQYCKLEHNYCKYCMNNKLENRKNAVALMVSSVGEALLKKSLKAMHASGNVELIKVNINKILM